MSALSYATRPPARGRAQGPELKKGLGHPLIRELIFKRRDSLPLVAVDEIFDCPSVFASDGGSLLVIPCAAELSGQNAELFVRRRS